MEYISRKIKESFDTISSIAAINIERSKSEWGSWIARVSNPIYPQNYIDIDIAGYERTHSVIYTVDLVIDNNIAASQQFEAYIADYKAYTANELAKEKLDEFFSLSAQVLNDKCEEPHISQGFIMYSYYMEDSMLEDHYQLLKDAGYGPMPGRDKIQDINEIINIKYNKEVKLMSENEKEYVSIIIDEEDIFARGIQANGKSLARVNGREGKSFLVDEAFLKESKYRPNSYYIGFKKDAYITLTSSVNENGEWKDIKEKVSPEELKERLAKVDYTVTWKQAQYRESEKGGFYSIIIPAGTELEGYTYTVREAQVVESERNENLLNVRLYRNEVHKAQLYRDGQVVDTRDVNGDMLKICYDEARKLGRSNVEVDDTPFVEVDDKDKVAQEIITKEKAKDAAKDTTKKRAASSKTKKTEDAPSGDVAPPKRKTRGR